ncbi:hypothetical protein NGM44_02390 [Moraxella sp. FZFQ2102]|nr:hypothetical protein [Moraxella sp. FZFQ2102]USZ15264.1 hypothetical protein NGM44_02390 [Moraxella sp. FZFQ2102]
MKKLIPPILALAITGCVSTAQPVKQPTVEQPAVEPIKTHIMYYWVDPITQG